MRKLKIALDGDGVLADTHELKRLVIQEFYGKILPRNCFFEEQVLGPILSLSEYRNVFDAVYASPQWGVERLQPMADIRFCYAELLAMRHELSVVTARADRPERPVLLMFEAWQDRHALNRSALFSSHGGSKSRMLQELQPDVFLDDHPQHIAEAVGCGVPHVFLFHHPYNEDMGIPHEAKRVSGWVRFLYEIRRIAENA